MNQMFVWPETVGSRDSHENSCCLIKNAMLTPQTLKILHIKKSTEIKIELI